MSSNILYMLNLVRISNFQLENLGKFEEVFEWRTPLGIIVAQELTEVRNFHLESIFSTLQLIKKERNRYIDAITAFIKLANSIGLQQFTGDLNIFPSGYNFSNKTICFTRIPRETLAKHSSIFFYLGESESQIFAHAIQALNHSELDKGYKSIHVLLLLYNGL